MSNDNAVKIENPEQGTTDILSELIKKSAREMLACAIKAEVEEFLASHDELLDGTKKRRVVRNGYLPERKITTTIGDVPVQMPRTRDRLSDASKEQIQFISKIIPKHLRRSASMQELLPLLYLKGISTNDFSDVLQPILGKNAKNISPGVVCKIKKAWENEYDSWQKSSLKDKNYVYIWADGIYLKARMEHEKSCVLVIIGARADGKKELIGLESGFRESKASWRELLIELQQRGLSVPPKLAIGDGALGFWGAISEVFPTTKHQRCWVHKISNILDKMPKSIRSKAKSLLQEIYNAETRADAKKALKKFVKKYSEKYSKATDCLVKDKDELLQFYDFPAANWVHIRTTNPIESTFATVRHRTIKAKGAFSRTTILTMVFKLIKGAEKRWKLLYGYKELDNVIKDVKFVDGLKVVSGQSVSSNETNTEVAA